MFRDDLVPGKSLPSHTSCFSSVHCRANCIPFCLSVFLKTLLATSLHYCLLLKYLFWSSLQNSSCLSLYPYFLFSPSSPILPLPTFCSLFPFQISCKIIMVSLATSIIHKATFVHNSANFTPSNLLKQLLAVALIQQILGIHFLLYLRYLPVISPSAFCQSMTLKSLLP